MNTSLAFDFKKLMAARFLFTLAVQIQAIVLGWHMYEITHDPLFLGFIGLVEAIPALGLAVFAGYIVDRSRPLIVYRRLLYVSFSSGFILLLSQWPSLELTHHYEVIALFSSSFLTGLARAFSQPSMFATVPRIVRRENLAKASAWLASSMQIARISGPALGGLLYGWLGVIGAATIVCGVLLFAITMLFLIKTKLPAHPPPSEKKSFQHEILVGAKFVFGHPLLLPALTLDMVAVLFGGVTALLPIYAAQILHIGATGLGLLRASPALGAALMSLGLTRLNFREKTGRWFFTSVAGYGFSILVFAVSQNYWLSGLALAFSGAFDSVSMVIRSTIVQLSSPDSMRGRISAINSMFIGSSNELGEFESGVAARLVGTIPAAVFGGVICLFTVVVMAIRFAPLRHLNLNTLEKAQS